jgi:hypothetical protein
MVNGTDNQEPALQLKSPKAINKNFSHNQQALLRLTQLYLNQLNASDIINQKQEGKKVRRMLQKVLNISDSQERKIKLDLNRLNVNSNDDFKKKKAQNKALKSANSPHKNSNCLFNHSDKITINKVLDGSENSNAIYLPPTPSS